MKRGGGPNPEGKGLVPVLATLLQARTSIAVPPKSLHQVSNELFTSLFVLDSAFAFRPVVGRDYFLYRRGEGFRLSLVSPDEWRDGSFGASIGRCELHADLTWTLELAPEAADDATFTGMVARRRERFEQELARLDRLDTGLPFHRAELPFQQRVFAAALAHSLRESLRGSGIAQLSYAQALAHDEDPEPG